MLKRETQEEVRLRGAATLVDMFNSGTVEALDPLLSLMGDQAGDRRVRLEALKILSFLPRSEARAIASGLLSDPDMKVAQAASAYSGAPQADRPGTEDALLDLGSTDYFIFRKAASLLASAGEEAVPTLVNALKERASDPAACARVASVLREITRGRERSVTRLLDETDETLPLALLVDIIGESTDRTALYHLKGVIDRLEPDGVERDPAREMILAKAHYYLARSGSRVAFDSLKRAMARQEGHLMGEILMAVQEIGGREELLDLITLYGREQGWMRDQIREAFHRLMKKSRTRADDSVFDRLDDRRRGWLTEILSVPGPHRGAPRGPARRRVDTM
jgi:hypothetical protein